MKTDFAVHFFEAFSGDGEAHAGAGMKFMRGVELLKETENSFLILLWDSNSVVAKSKADPARCGVARSGARRL